jgi:hypothetical protein
VLCVALIERVCLLSKTTYGLVPSKLFLRIYETVNVNQDRPNRSIRVTAQHRNSYTHCVACGLFRYSTYLWSWQIRLSFLLFRLWYFSLYTRIVLYSPQFLNIWHLQVLETYCACPVWLFFFSLSRSCWNWLNPTSYKALVNFSAVLTV